MQQGRLHKRQLHSILMMEINWCWNWRDDDGLIREWGQPQIRKYLSLPHGSIT